MTKLEQQIAEALQAEANRTENYTDYYSLAPVVAKIALELAENAFRAGEQNIDNDGCYIDHDAFKQFIQDYE